jgi:solute carrier family 29 (equilibrative nucleoside transporter), member 1/2/3
MDRLKSFFQKKGGSTQEYQPLNEEAPFLERETDQNDDHEVSFSWIEYGIFALLGVAMLWAWYDCTLGSTAHGYCVC